MKIKKWIIYGKLLKEYGKMKPMKKFSALDTFGKPVSRIGNAKWYDTKESAENIINITRTHGIPEDLVAFEVRHVVVEE